MTTATLTCSLCSDPIDENLGGAFPVGKCCHNLPAPWHMGRGGYYTQTTPRDEDPEDLDEETTEPECVSCGRSSFECLERQRSWRYVNESDGQLLIGDEYDCDTIETVIRCEHCSEPYVGRWEYE